MRNLTILFSITFLWLAVAQSSLAEPTDLWFNQYELPSAPKDKEGLFRWADGEIVSAIGADGSMVIAGVITKDMEFPEGNALAYIDGGSTYIIKYGADGTPLWGTSVFGAATPTAITTDAAGNIYLAGAYADVIEFRSVSGNLQQLEGWTGMTVKTTAYLAKYSPAGECLAAIPYMTEPIASLAESGLYFPEPADIYVSISSLVIYGDKLYLSALMTGERTVGGQLITGSYYDVYGFMYLDAPVAIVESLDLTLNNPAIEVYSLGEVAKPAASTCFDIHLAATPTGVVVGLLASGVQTVTNSLSKQQTISIDRVLDADGLATKQAPGYIFFPLNMSWHKLYNGSLVEFLVATYSTIANMAVYNNDLYVMGSFTNNLAFDTNIKALDAQDIYLVGLDLQAGSFKSAVHISSPGEDLFSQMTIASDKLLFSSSFKGSVKVGDISIASQLTGWDCYGGAFDLKTSELSAEPTINPDVANAQIVAMCSNGTKFGGILLEGDVESVELNVSAVDLDEGSAIDQLPIDSELTLYPNPTVEQLFFSKECSVALYSMQGALLQTAQTASSINVSSLVPGLYMVKLQSQEGTARHTFIKR